MHVWQDYVKYFTEIQTGKTETETLGVSELKKLGGVF